MNPHPSKYFHRGRSAEAAEMQAEGTNALQQWFSTFRDTRHPSLDSRHPPVHNFCELRGTPFQKLMYIFQCLPPLHRGWAVGVRDHSGWDKPKLAYLLIFSYFSTSFKGSDVPASWLRITALELFLAKSPFPCKIPLLRFLIPGMSLHIHCVDNVNAHQCHSSLQVHQSETARPLLKFEHGPLGKPLFKNHCS